MIAPPGRHSSYYKPSSTLCNKGIDDDYEDECCDFQDELFNFE
jgi:hypothetical protein